MEEVAREAWEVNGWRVFYQIGIEERWFEGSNKPVSFLKRIAMFLKGETTRLTPYEAVFYSDFESFVERVSIMKAKI